MSRLPANRLGRSFGETPEGSRTGSLFVGRQSRPDRGATPQKAGHGGLVRIPAACPRPEVFGKAGDIKGQRRRRTTGTRKELGYSLPVWIIFSAPV
jgi:hypothetical protein